MFEVSYPMFGWSHIFPLFLVHFPLLLEFWWFIRVNSPVHRAGRQKPLWLLSSFHFCSLCVCIFLSFFLTGCVRGWKILFIFSKNHVLCVYWISLFHFVFYSISFFFIHVVPFFYVFFVFFYVLFLPFKLLLQPLLTDRNLLAKGKWNFQSHSPSFTKRGTEEWVWIWEKSHKSQRIWSKWCIFGISLFFSGKENTEFPPTPPQLPLFFSHPLSPPPSCLPVSSFVLVLDTGEIIVT